MKSFFLRYCSIYKVWDRNSIAKWECQKQKGIFKFIMAEGVIKWGILATSIFLGVSLYSREYNPQEIIITCSIWLIASIIYGLSLWCGTSLAYKEQIRTIK